MYANGWTPCKHYNNCIGYCPVCGEINRLLSVGAAVKKTELETLHWEHFVKPMLEAALGIIR